MLSGQVPLSFYKVGTIRSDLKPYQNIPLFQKFSKIKIKTKNTPSKMVSDLTKVIARSQGTYEYMLKISDQLHCFNSIYFPPMVSIEQKM